MKQHVRTFIQNCPCCQKLSAKDPKINTSHFATSNYAIFDTLNVDYIGPFPDKGYILVIIDTFTRWTELFWCADADAKSAAGCLLAHFGRFGSPNMIRSDRGSHFANELTKELLDLCGTPHNLTLAYSKQENAIVERVNKEVKRHLRGLVFDKQSQSCSCNVSLTVQLIDAQVLATLIYCLGIDLNRGILTPYLSVGTHSRSAYIVSPAYSCMIC